MHTPAVTDPKLRTALEARHPSTIALDIMRNIPKAGSVWTYCRPYVLAMAQLDSWLGTYRQESAREIGLRFLCNAGQWRGAQAKRLKNEVRRALGMPEAK